jgi:CheY-like chemotaxis protein
MKKSKRVLLIEDDEIVHKLISKLVSQRGAEIVIASTPAQIKAAIATDGDTFSLVFIDLIMPEVTGWDVIKLIDSDQKTSNLPLVILTGAMLSQQEREKLLKRASAIIEKQKMTLEIFNAMIDKWL